MSLFRLQDFCRTWSRLGFATPFAHKSDAYHSIRQCAWPMTISVNHQSSTPKYKQIINAVLQDIETRKEECTMQLPSINELSLTYDISRDTVEKAYKQLKAQGFILSVPGKGYFTTGKGIAEKRRVLLLFNKLSEYKRNVYEGFVKHLQGADCVDLKIYHEELDMFDQLLRRHRDDYSDFVIIPAFRGEAELHARQAIRDRLSGRRVWWLSATMDGLSDVNGAVYQNFREDIYLALGEARDHLLKYRKFNLIFPSAPCYPREIIYGFQAFCREEGVASEVLFNSYSKHIAQEGNAYLVLKEDHLVALVKKIKQGGLQAGKNVGILAYNDSPLKEVLLDGISVVSTDHYAMGMQAARLISDSRSEFVENKFEYIPRNTL